jgi:hypothetical protein
LQRLPGRRLPSSPPSRRQPGRRNRRPRQRAAETGLHRRPSRSSWRHRDPASPGQPIDLAQHATLPHRAPASAPK